ncbi:MAG TPA: glycosyltransferase family 39 protein [Planctomycetota bacterium]|nr:glycosyltransferase family 39 protein [Planctomycetota bacterium]
MRWLLPLVLLIGVALRVQHLDYGLDTHDLSRAILSHQQDEEGMVRAVLSGAGAGRYPWQSPSAGLLRGDPQPGIYMLWGSLGYYVFGAADALVLWPLSWRHPGGWHGLLAGLDANPSLLHLVHRSVSVLAAVLALLAIGRIARRLLGARGELLALAIAGSSYLPAREAHFGVLDTLAALWIVLAVEQSLLLVQGGTWRRYLLAGLFVGLAAATKYFGGMVVLVVLAAHVGLARRARRPWHAFGRLVAAGALAVVAFVAVSPQVLFWPDQLLGALRWQRDTIGINLVNESGGPWELALHHLQHTFAAGFGETALVFAVMGGWLMWRRGPAARLAVLSVLLLVPMFFVARSPAVRYGIAPVLLLAVPAAAFCEAAGETLGRRWPERREMALLVALGLCVAPSFLRIVFFNRSLGRTDTRTEALGWLAELHAPREQVFAFGFTGLPRPGLIAKWPTPYVDYLRVVQGGKWFTREEGRKLRPRYVLHDETGSNFDFAGWSDWVDIVASEYHVIRRIEPRDDLEIRLPDKAAGTPSFYLPFDDPWGMDRPGPVLTLYERTAVRSGG